MHSLDLQPRSVISRFTSSAAARQAERRHLASQAIRIRTAFLETIKEPDATILVAGYSPTGGGHTLRLLNVIKMSIEKNSLKAGSTVVLHVPEKWEGRARPRALEDLALSLDRAGITVIVAQAEKSVLGYLNSETGVSDDVKILSRFAHLPLRRDADLNDVSECLLYTGKGSIDWQDLPSISANSLMTSMTSMIGPAAMSERVKVFTDMDPALQKAASEAGVPGHNRVDQQNHAILISQDKDGLNIAPKNAVLANVLGGHGEIVSHIGLGEKNTLQDLLEIAAGLGVNRRTTKAEALETISQHLLDYGNPIQLPPEPGQHIEGILRHPSLRNPKDVKNIIHVYAHANQHRIAEHVFKAMQRHGGDEAYTRTLFVFCGENAIDRDRTDIHNPMRIASIGDSDAITTAGAGTVGEYIYLARQGKAKAGFMVLPIEGHDEQAANATYVAGDPKVRSRVSIITNTESLERDLDAFIRRRSEQAPQKYARGTMAPLLAAARKPETYVGQTHQLLFPPYPRQCPGIDPLSRTVHAMRESTGLIANRNYIKLTFQILEQLDRNFSVGRTTKTLKVKLTKNGATDQYDTLAQFRDVFLDDARLKTALDSDIDVNDHVLLNLAQARNLISRMAGTPHPSQTDMDSFRQDIADLKQQFAVKYTTGF